MTQQPVRPPTGGTYPRHNEGELYDAASVARQLGIPLEHVTRIANQLADEGGARGVRDRRINGKGLHMLTVSEMSKVQNAYVAHFQHPQGETEMQQANVTQGTKAPSNKVRTEEECAVLFGEGSGRRYTVEEFSASVDPQISPVSARSYVYRNLLPRRKDEPTPSDPYPDWHFFESDSKIFDANRTPRPTQFQRKQEEVVPAHPVQQEVPPMTAQPSFPASFPSTPTPAVTTALVEQVDPIDVSLVDPKGLAHATKLARLCSYLFTRVGAIDIDEIKKIDVIIRLEPELPFDLEELELKITPQVTYWEVLMSTSSHPDSAELYQVVLTDRFRHVRVETDPTR